MPRESRNPNFTNSIKIVPVVLKQLFLLWQVEWRASEWGRVPWNTPILLGWDSVGSGGKKQVVMGATWLTLFRLAFCFILFNPFLKKIWEKLGKEKGEVKNYNGRAVEDE